MLDSFVDGRSGADHPALGFAPKRDSNPRPLTVHFTDTKSRALATSGMAQNALPIGAGVLVAAGVSPC
jgi:hypothetical protein